MIRVITIENFVGFTKIDIPNVSGFNVVIGANDTGKTNFLKLLYATVKSHSDFKQNDNIKRQSFSETISDKILNTFQPRKSGLSELVAKSANNKLKFELSIEGSKGNSSLSFSIGERAQKTVSDCTTDSHLNDIGNSNAIFIPAKEVLTAFRAIAFTRENFEMYGFDDTYFDLIKQLRIPTQQGKVAREFVDVNDNLASLFEGEIKQDLSNPENPFFFKKGKAEFSMNLTAEGIKKIGILTTLIRNRSLSKNTVLFLDEPETALHPKAIRLLAEMLFKIKTAGVQIFLTTHNYFLIKQLSIISKREKETISCLSLVKTDSGLIDYSIEDLQYGMPSNSIVDEALAMFNEELKNDLS